MGLTIRITAKLAKRVKEPLVDDPTASPGLFGDWYANLLYIERQQIILAISEKTLLPLLIPAKDAKLFPKRLMESLGNSLAALNIPKEQIAILSLHGATFSSFQVSRSMNRISF